MALFRATKSFIRGTISLFFIYYEQINYHELFYTRVTSVGFLIRLTYLFEYDKDTSN